MNTTVTTHRILVSLIVVLIALLIPFGRALERAMQVLPLAYLQRNYWILVLAALAAILIVARRGIGHRFHRGYVIGLTLMCIFAVLFLRTSAEWCHFLTYGLLAIGLAGSNLHPATVRVSLLIGGAIGIADELIQGQTPGRIADPWDIITDLLGLLAGLWIFKGERSSMCHKHDLRECSVGQPLATAKVIPSRPREA